MATFTCKSCNKQLAPYRRYDDSDWCEDCVELVLLDQALEDTNVVLPEIIG